MAEKIGEVIPEQIHLLAARVIKYKIDSSDEYLENPISPQGLEFSLAKDIAHNFDEEMARYRLYFELIGMKNENEKLELEAEIGIEFHFKIENFKQFLKESKDETQVSLDIAASLMAIAYSTSRGMILEKTQNTYFNGIIIPVIDATKFLLKDELID